jgi:hypothetical protein
MQTFLKFTGTKNEIEKIMKKKELPKEIFHKLTTIKSHKLNNPEPR